MKVSVETLFSVRSGDFHAFKELDPGKTPLVSCGDTDNGVVGYYDIPKENQYSNLVTVAYNGSWPIMAKYHPYAFGAKDDVAVLVPLADMSDLGKIYVAAVLNRMTWRYSYGRKCFREKLEKVLLPLPVVKQGNQILLDETAVSAAFPGGVDGIAKSIVKGAWTKSKG